MKTPRTTAFFESQHISVRETDLDRWEKMTEFARELERENIRLREALDHLTDYAIAARDLLKNTDYARLLDRNCVPIDNARAALAVTPSC